MTSLVRFLRNDWLKTATRSQSPTTDDPTRVNGVADHITEALWAQALTSPSPQSHARDLLQNPITYEGAWQISLSRILQDSELRFNPLRYAPAAEDALTKVLELADSDDWTVETLGDFATVFNGPRFKRPFAAEGATTGAGIIKMYTPKALFEERGESLKYLDLGIASAVQRRAIEVLTLRRDYIMIVDSGTAGKLLGKVGMTTTMHDGCVGNNNMIRVIIDDPLRRDYVYYFLRSELAARGKNLLQYVTSIAV